MATSLRRIGLFASFLCLVAVTCARGDESPAAKAQAAKAPVAITISKETTFITEPLRKDGYVDYVAALDEKCREGVTPENNAAVLFWQAVGPAELWKESREQHFRRLGMTPLRETGDYFVNLAQYLAMQQGAAKQDNRKFDLERDRELRQMLGPLKRRPWSKEESPVIAEWLAANEKPLALVIEASKRPRFYDLQIDEGRTRMIGLFSPCIGYFHQPGDVVSALIVRAMLRLHDGERETAWGDLLACHRLARLVGQGPMVVHALVPSRMDEEACGADQAFLQHVHLTAAEAARMRDDLERLPRMPTPGEKIDPAERYTVLDCVATFAREGIASLKAFSKPPYPKEYRATINRLRQSSANVPLDWDASLRLANAWFDRIAAARNLATREEQRKTLRQIEEDFRKLKWTVADADSLEKAIPDDARTAISQRLGEFLLCFFVPDVLVSGYPDVSDRQAMRFDLDKLSFALAAYRADHAAYPAKLDSLKPKYVAEVPGDLCTGGPLNYQRTRDGYLLYSVGNNGRDDGRKGYDDCEAGKSREELAKTGEDWDDLAVVMPAPPEKKAKGAAAKTGELSASDRVILDSLSKKIRQSVREFGDCDETANDFARLALDWTDFHGRVMLLALAKKIYAAKQDYEKQILTMADRARVEAEAVDEFMDAAFFRVIPSRDPDLFSLDSILREKSASCLGCTQLFYVLGNSIGLTTQSVFVPERSENTIRLGVSHVASVVHLADGKVIFVDFTTRNVSEPFLFLEYYRETGNYWELKDQQNLLGIHKVLQLLDQKGLLGFVDAGRARDAVKAGKADEAVRLLTTAIEGCPRNAMIRCGRGGVYHELKQYDDAVADCSRAIELDPKYTAAYIDRAVCHVKLQQYEAAIADFSKAIELNPKSPEVYCGRGAVHVVLKEADKALADFEKAIEIDPKFGKGYLGRGGSHAMLGQKDEAKSDLKKAVELDPSLKEAAEKAAREYGIEL
jgi:hypothetical protein